MPYDAFDAEHEIQDNDILILASDGVFDNLYDEDVEACVLGAAKDVSLTDPTLSEEALQAASVCIADRAHELGYNTNYLSPFAKDAKAQGVDYPHKGKDDDIVAIAAQIHTEKEGRPTQKLSTNGIPNTPEHDSWEHVEL